MAVVATEFAATCAKAGLMPKKAFSGYPHVLLSHASLRQLYLAQIKNGKNSQKTEFSFF